MIELETTAILQENIEEQPITGAILILIWSTLKFLYFFHNLKGYDAKLIISEYINFSEKRFSGIPQNTEKFISFKIGKLAFNDSLAFLPSSLDKLIKNLKYTNKNLHDDWEKNF